jgi:hypothetical protein
VHEGRSYDSKAIVAAAHGYQFPADGPLDPAHRSGGAATVVRKLRELGFIVVTNKRSVLRDIELYGAFAHLWSAQTLARVDQLIDRGVLRSTGGRFPKLGLGRERIAA